MKTFFSAVLVLAFAYTSFSPELAFAKSRRQQTIQDDQDTATAAPATPYQSQDSSQSISMQRPNVISIEGFGRGILYSVNYDRSVSDSVSLGVGFSYFSASSDALISFSAYVVPVYVNYYFITGNHRPFITGGLDLVVASANTSSSGTIRGTGAAAVFGGGYEYRGDGGFLFRAAPYILVAGGGAELWAGVSFGYAF